LHKHFSGKLGKVRAKILRTAKNSPAPTLMKQNESKWKFQ